eukprot:1521293-Rhodomonas_salina.1
MHVIELAYGAMHCGVLTKGMVRTGATEPAAWSRMGPSTRHGLCSWYCMLLCAAFVCCYALLMYDAMLLCYALLLYDATIGCYPLVLYAATLGCYALLLYAAVLHC